MKVMTSRGIATKLICCTAMVVLMSSVMAFSATPQSGALLEITGNVTDGVHTTAVNLKVYDSQIHTGFVGVPELPGTSPASNCSSGDEIPTDAYLLQAGAATGCDEGDLAEGNLTHLGSFKFVSPPTSTVAYKFDISTQYLCGPNSGVCTAAAQSNTSGNITSNDTGFLTVLNNGSSSFTGTIKLSGTPQGTLCGTSPLSDSVSNLAAGASKVLALSNDSSSCGGFNAPQTLTLTANQESKAFFGKDDYIIKPLNSAAGAKLDVLPVPVPAGPTGSEQSPAASSLYFSPGTTFSNLKCIPYADFSALNNPVCVELQLTPSDAGNYLYTATNDFNIDKHSLPSGVGGPSFLGDHGVNCPDSGFNINIFFSYTAPDVTNGDPLKGGGSGTGSCWVTAFDPNAVGGPISTGTTFSFFEGFQSPVSDTDENLYKPGSAIPLIFQLFSSPGVGNPNFSLCPGPTVPTSNVCPSTQATANWVFFGQIKTACISDNTPNDDLLNDFAVAAGASVLQNFGDGTYQYNLKTQKPASGCFDAVLIFDSGLTLFPANFKAKN